MHSNIPMHQQKDREILIKRLEEANLSLKRFLKVDEKKAAFELEWQLHLYAPEELKDYPRWGICGGEGLVPLEADKPEMVNILRKILPPTLEVITPRRQLPHFFFKILDGEIPNRTLHLPNDPEGAGEIRAKNQYFVATGTEIEFNDLKTGELKTGTYKILHDRPIAELTYQQFMSSIKPFLGKESDQNLTKEIMFNGAQKGTRHHYGIRYATRLIRYEKLDAVATLDVMKRWNQKCNPPMNEKDLERMTKKAIEYSLSESVLDKKSFLDMKTQTKTKEENKFVQKLDKMEPDMGFALQLLDSQFDFICPTDTVEIMVYQDGIYVSGKLKICEVLENEYGKDLKNHFLDESLGHIERANYVEREKINKFTNKIPIQNGLFNFVTQEIETFQPEEFFTYKLNIKYDPTAECPKFKEFIKQILPNHEDIQLLQEIMGYCLVPSMPFHKIFWFYGIGRNGKDRIILTLQHILGKENCSQLNLSEFREGRRFSLCQLYGKLLNVSSEPDSKYSIQTNILKLISGENTIYAELKGKNQRLTFTNKAKPIIVGNSFPKVTDTSIGFWERVIVLNFPQSFTGEEVIPNIERRWLDDPTEVSGIFNWMLEGLYRIKKSKIFTSSKTTEETKAEFMRVSDPYNAWIIDCCNIITEAYLTRKEAYDNYKEYTDEIGATPDTTRVFYMKMRQTPKIKDAKMRINDKIERVFQGITLKSVADVAVVAGCTSQEKNLTNNSKDKIPATTATSATSATKDVGSYFPTCFLCHKPVSRAEELTNIDGKPCHMECKQKLEKDRILK